MAQNYAAAYAPMAEEAFALASLTQGVFSAKYDWTGVKTVNVFTNGTLAMGDYVISSGYGSPTVVGNTVDDLVVSKDRKFNGLIDRLLMDSTEGSIRAAEWLGEQTRQKVVPDIDGYRFDALHDGCPSAQISASAAITSANAYTEFLAGQVILDELLVPQAGRVCFATPDFLNKIKLDSNYTKATDLAQGDILYNGQVGMIDGVPVIKTPSAVMNATDNHMDFIIVHRDAVAVPMKLEDVQIFETVPNWSGSQIQGRYVHDLFVLDAKNTGIYVHRHG